MVKYILIEKKIIKQLLRTLMTKTHKCGKSMIKQSLVTLKVTKISLELTQKNWVYMNKLWTDGISLKIVYSNIQ